MLKDTRMSAMNLSSFNIFFFFFFLSWLFLLCTQDCGLTFHQEGGRRKRKQMNSSKERMPQIGEIPVCAELILSQEGLAQCPCPFTDMADSYRINSQTTSTIITKSPNIIFLVQTEWAIWSRRKWNMRKERWEKNTEGGHKWWYWMQKPWLDSAVLFLFQASYPDH